MSEELVLQDENTEEERARVAGAWLRRQRSLCGWSQHNLMIEILYAEGNCPAANTIARWERGEERPRKTKYLHALGKLFGVEGDLMVKILHFREVHLIPKELPEAPPVEEPEAPIAP